ncbi:DUF6491 family protein [Henriciella mobilis]|nr:DUF6491 family protein [Henriciella mobilis]RIJ15651.1 hypothetical protein D1231_13010 [Henriciella mobilis]RIJ19115.1 hypothetical protein D1227_19360 [Henriciella mobilis]
MKHLIRTALACGAVTAMVAACTSAPDEQAADADWMTDARLGEQVDRICFSSSIDNFRAPSRDTVIVEKGVNDEYLIQTFGNCYNLRNAQALSLDTFGGSSCLSKGDAIFAYDSVFGPDKTDIGPVRCPIKAIYEWNEDAAEAEEDSEDAASDGS